MNKLLYTLILFIMINTGFCAYAQSPVLPDSTFSYCAPIRMELFLAGNFGELRNNHFHAGLDFKTQGSINHPVYSFADGYVCRVGVNALGYGLTVYVRHPQLGLTSVYAHLNSFSDQISEKLRQRQSEMQVNNIQATFAPSELPVKMGDVIARSGNTGSSAGPHVHFELRDCNDEDDEFYNPMPFFRDSIADHKPPRASSLYFYPLGGVINGLRARQSASVIVTQSGQRTINKRLTGWGRVGVGLKAFDYIENMGNTYGLYRVSLFVDDSLVYRFTCDKFRYSERRYTNSLTDFRGWVNQRAMVQKSFVEPGNHLRMIDQSLGDGTVVIDQERNYDFRYELEDYHGNKSEVFFHIKGKKSALPGDPYKGVVAGTMLSKGILVRHDQPLEFDSAGFHISMPAGNMYDDTELPYKRTAPTDPNIPCVSPVYAVGNTSMPLHDHYMLTIPVPKAYADTLTCPRQLYVWNLEGGYVGGTYLDGAMHVKLLEFGRFVVRRDTSKPSAVIVSMTWNRAQISVSDRGSGVARYKVFIDDQFVPFDLNRYGRRLARPRDFGIQRGKMHDVRIWVQDHCGNENVVHYKKFF